MRQRCAMAERLGNLHSRPLARCGALCDSYGIRFGDFNLARGQELLDVGACYVALLRRRGDGPLDAPFLGDGGEDGLPFGCCGLFPGCEGHFGIVVVIVFVVGRSVC